MVACCLGPAKAIAAAARAFCGRRSGIAIGTAPARSAWFLLSLSCFLLLAVGPGAPFAAALPLGLAAVFIWPLMPGIDRRPLQAAIAMLMLAALAIALWMRLDPLPRAWRYLAERPEF